jgi:hypothetical protein
MTAAHKEFHGPSEAVATPDSVTVPPSCPTIEEKDLDAAEKAITVAKLRLRELQMTYAKQSFGVEVGTKVVGRNGRQGHVKKLQFWGTGRPWVEVHEIKKDGTTGLRTLNFFGDWKVAS